MSVSGCAEVRIASDAGCYRAKRALRRAQYVKLPALLDEGAQEGRGGCGLNQPFGLVAWREAIEAHWRPHTEG